MAVIRQAGFHGGELAPNLHSRTDLATRAFAARMVRNFIPTATGAAMNRPGFKFIAECGLADTASRLVPFTFSSDQSYVLEFGHLFVRVFKAGVEVPPAPRGSAWMNLTVYAVGDFVTWNGGVYESLQGTNVGHTPSDTDYWKRRSAEYLDSPFTASQLPDLRFVQSGDVLTITTQAAYPTELVRLADDNWEFREMHTFPDLPAGAATWLSTPTFISAPTETTTGTHVAKLWDWVVTGVYGGVESLPSAKLTTASGKAIVDPEYVVGLQTTAPAVAPDTYNWYRGRYGVYGYVGNSAQPKFADEGQAPDYTTPPPSGRDPFLTGGYPAVAEYHQQRLAFANQTDYPQRVLASQTGRFHSFDYGSPQKDSDAVDFTVASRKYEEVRALVSLKGLVVLTANTEYVVDNGDKPLTPTTINLAPVSTNGCAPLQPLVVNNSIIYLQAQRAAVRELNFDGGKAGWGGSDVSLVANHLLATSGLTILDWTYQRLPHSVVWAVRSDGELVSLTYSREMGVAAWATHYTPSGSFESICCVPEGTEDAVYAIVARSVPSYVGSPIKVTRRCIERLDTRLVDSLTDASYLDSHVRVDGTVIFSTVSGLDTRLVDSLTDASYLDSHVRVDGVVQLPTVSGLDHLNGVEVMALVDGAVQGPFTVSGGSVTLTTPGSKACVGLAYDCGVELLDLYGGARTTTDVSDHGPEFKNVTKVIWEVDRTAGLAAGETVDELNPWREDIGYEAPAGGLDHLQFVVPINGSWNRGGRAILVQSQPLPVTVLGASRVVETGGV